MANREKKAYSLDIWVHWPLNPGVRCRKTRGSSDWEYIDYESNKDLGELLDKEEVKQALYLLLGQPDGT